MGDILASSRTEFAPDWFRLPSQSGLLDWAPWRIQPVYRRRITTKDRRRNMKRFWAFSSYRADNRSCCTAKPHNHIAWEDEAPVGDGAGGTCRVDLERVGRSPAAGVGRSRRVRAPERLDHVVRGVRCDSPDATVAPIAAARTAFLTASKPGEGGWLAGVFAELSVGETRDQVLTVATYLSEYPTQLKYFERLASGLSIGNGALERAINQAVNLPAMRTGARWRAGQVGSLVEVWGHSHTPHLAHPPDNRLTVGPNEWDPPHAFWTGGLSISR